jgi:hypothetical protein
MVWAIGSSRSSPAGASHTTGLGTHRWVIEQTIALLHWFCRLRIRCEIRDDIHEAFIPSPPPSSAGRRLTR